MNPKGTVSQLWDALYRRDWHEIAACFTTDAHYTDVPAPDLGAVGPDAIVRRLRIGLGPLEHIEHHLERMAVDGEWVFTEHAETWHWPTGESVTLPFVSVMQVRDGLIAVWRDYWDYQTLLGNAPSWWVDHIMEEYARDPFTGPTP